jgi:hypothetical protein
MIGPSMLGPVPLVQSPPVAQRRRPAIRFFAPIRRFEPAYNEAISAALSVGEARVMPRDDGRPRRGRATRRATSPSDQVGARSSPQRPGTATASRRSMPRSRAMTFARNLEKLKPLATSFEKNDAELIVADAVMCATTSRTDHCSDHDIVSHCASRSVDRSPAGARRSTSTASQMSLAAMLPPDVFVAGVSLATGWEMPQAPRSSVSISSSSARSSARTPPRASIKSGRLARVRRSAAARRQRATRRWSPERSTSGTVQPR